MNREEKKLLREAQLRIAKLKPKGVKVPESLAARADWLYNFDKKVKEESRKVEALKDFVAAVKAEFLLIIPADPKLGAEASSIGGKVGRVESQWKEKPIVEDWDAFWKYVKKNDAMDMIPHSISAEAVRERWANKKVVPGVSLYRYRSLSLTKVKK